MATQLVSLDPYELVAFMEAMWRPKSHFTNVAKAALAMFTPKIGNASAAQLANILEALVGVPLPQASQQHFIKLPFEIGTKVATLTPA